MNEPNQLPANQGNTNTLCQIRDLYRSIQEFESAFEAVYDLCLNQGMLLCSLAQEQPLSSGEIAQRLGLSLSNTSKVLKTLECKGFVRRKMGRTDKRQMYFKLTPIGESKLNVIKHSYIEMPEPLSRILSMDL